MEDPRPFPDIGTLGTITPAHDVLGECPTWSDDEQALYWVDVRRPAIRRYQYDTGRIASWTMPELIGGFALCEDGSLAVTLKSGVALFDPATESLTPIASLHEPSGDMRLNDTKCDRQGRLWFGSMNDTSRAPVGWLYRLTGNDCTAVVDGISVPNSLCWSPDGRTMYFADGREAIIWQLPFDPDSGTVGDRRLFARLPPDSGIPDGATVDADGFVWSAQYGAGVVTRYNPEGTVERIVELPVSQPTSCAFGGPKLDTLFITTATQRLSADTLAAQPQAGAVLALPTDTTGIPEPRFAYRSDPSKAGATS